MAFNFGILKRCAEILKKATHSTKKHKFVKNCLENKNWLSLLKHTFKLTKIVAFDYCADFCGNLDQNSQV